ncbi:MAG: type 4a pilus biogenesis protein PilO [Deltaproteobacteria bacterium]|nr:type 4a pilus biogenesis protein PilO [Deltaproteobacteria bacterium]MBW2136278.1 type 4a pilus biogenesis protein PilO [Deltaproteobacteria bacterium]
MKTEALFQKVEQIKMPIRILILVGTIVLLGGAYLWFVYIPKTEEIAETKQRIAQLESRLRRAKVRARALKKFEADLAQVEAQFREALRLLPNEKEIPNLLRTITQLGSDSQLEFRLFRPQRVKAKDFYMEIPVSIEVSGNYHNVALFFDKVGRMERIVNIFNVSMRPVAPRSTRLITNCDAVTYSFKGEGNGERPAKKK